MVKKTAAEIPVTEAGSLLGCLDISSPVIRYYTRQTNVVSPPLEEDESDYDTTEAATSVPQV